MIVCNPTPVAYREVESNCQRSTVDSRQPIRGVMQFSLQIWNTRLYPSRINGGEWTINKN